MLVNTFKYDNGNGVCIREDLACCDYEGVKEEIVRAQSALCRFAELEIREKCYGQECGEDYEKKSKEINDLLDTIKSDYKKLLSGNKPCLKCSDFQKVREQLIAKIPANCGVRYEDIIVDTSGEEQWAFDHPEGVSYECWNKWSRVIARNFQINIQMKAKEIY